MDLDKFYCSSPDVARSIRTETPDVLRNRSKLKRCRQLSVRSGAVGLNQSIRRNKSTLG